VTAVPAGRLTETRTSALPLAFKCPGSVRRPTLPVADDARSARLGRAVHEVLRGLVETGAVAWVDVNGAATRHEVEPGEVGALCGMAQKLWPTIADSFRDALTELEFSAELAPGFRLTGHVDVIAVSGTAARIADWKTGRRDYDYSQQLKGYCVLALLEDPELAEATATAIWIRDGEIENYTMPRAAISPWVKDLLATVVEWDGVFHPGPHCGFCPRSHECEARTALVRRDVAGFVDDLRQAESSLAEMAPMAIVELLRRADTVGYQAKRVRDAIKAFVAERGELVGDGVKLTIDVETRREIKTLEAWPIIEALDLDAGELAECVDVSISLLEKAAARKAGRGKGAAAVRALGAELEAAGAVTVSPRTYLREKRT